MHLAGGWIILISISPRSKGRKSGIYEYAVYEPSKTKACKLVRIYTNTVGQKYVQLRVAKQLSRAQIDAIPLRPGQVGAERVIF